MDAWKVLHHLFVAMKEIDHALTLMPNKSRDRRVLDRIYDDLSAVRCRVIRPPDEEAS